MIYVQLDCCFQPCSINSAALGSWAISAISCFTIFTDCGYSEASPKNSVPTSLNQQNIAWTTLKCRRCQKSGEIVSKLYQVMNSYDEHVCNDSKDKRTLIKHEPFLHISTDYRVGLAIYYTETRSEPTCVTAWPNDTVILMCFVGTH